MKEVKVGDFVEVDFGTGRTTGEVIKVNVKTIWVKILWAGKNIEIKRHLEKHGIVILD